MGVRQTRTYAELELSAAAYQEIREKLIAAGYGHAFGIDHEYGDAIDMHGIAVTCKAGSETKQCDCDVGMCTHRKDCRDK